MSDIEPAPIFRVLNDHGVAYVVIGGMAAEYQGVQLGTEDADVTPAMDTANLDRLADALAELGAQMLDPDGNPIDLPEPRIEPELMVRMRSFRTKTPFGTLDVSFKPGGTDGFDDLVRRATFVVVDSVAAPVADLRDVIRSKAAAGRDKDLAVLPELEARAAQLERIKETQTRIPVDPSRFIDD